MYVCVGLLHQIEEEEEDPAATSIRRVRKDVKQRKIQFLYKWKKIVIKSD